MIVIQEPAQPFTFTNSRVLFGLPSKLRKWDLDVQSLMVPLMMIVLYVLLDGTP